MKLLKADFPGNLRPFLFILIILPALLLPGSTQAQDKAAGKCDTLFFDNFSGTSLDRTRWNVVVTGWTVNNEQQAYIDSSSAIRVVHGTESEGALDGALAIEPHFRPGFTTKEGKKFDFTSGRIDTRGKFEFSYGSASARMKLPEGSGFWPAFWLLGTGRWPDTGEIDIMENVGESDWTSVALHGPGYSGETPLVNKAYFPKDNDASKWHVYSVDWKPEGLIFQIDGVTIYRATRAMIENYGRWSYDNPKYIILNLALGGAYPVKTNGVKTPYPGIPESTVQMIKNNKARVLVDWVLITRDK